MLWAIASFEIRRQLQKLSTYVYFAVFFAMACLFFMASGGAFKGVNMGIVAGGKTLVNSPFALHLFITLLSYFGLQVTAAVMGQALYQDIESKATPLFFTLPITRRDYLLGRFLGALVTLAIIYASIGLGCFVGAHMPGVEPSLLGPNRASAYLWPYLVGALPNLIFTGAIFFSMAALTRKIRAVYVSSVLILLGYLVGSSLTSRIENKMIASLVDPLGVNATAHLTEYWTVAERNTRLVPLSGALLYNRLLWLAVGAVLLVITFLRFRLAHVAEGEGKAKPIVDPPPEITAHATQSPASRTAAKAPSALGLLPQLTLLSFKETVKNAYFLVIVLAGVLSMIIVAHNMGRGFAGTPTYPVTYTVLEATAGSFNIFLLAIITLYAGELVWRERDAQMSQIADALPIPTWLPFLGKLLALFLVQIALLAVVMITSLGIQAGHGYFHFEIGHYLIELFGIRLVRMCLVCVLAVAIQVIVDHKYIGYFIMVLYYIMIAFLPRFGFEHHLYQYGTLPAYTYSDMNGYGHFAQPIAWLEIHWAAAAVLLAVASNVLWVRGLDGGLRARLRLARQRWSRSLTAVTTGAGLAYAATFGFIYYNTNILNRYRTQREADEILAEAERAYKSHEDDAQPRITGVTLAADIYPEDRRVDVHGTYRIVNKTPAPISQILVHLSPKAKVKRLAVGGAEAATRPDPVHGYYGFDLPAPLAPAAETSLTFEITYEHRGFENDEKENRIVYNGTFFDTTETCPGIGYLKTGELADDDVRRKHGLAPRPRMADLDDLHARRNTYIATDADWIDFDATVSTSPDQIAVAPGTLDREWTEGGRRYFHYKSPSKVLSFASIMSARYAVKKDRWNDVAIEIFHHPSHTFDTGRMIASIKASLDYFTKNFGPYQHTQVRILEFPRYQSFAQSFPNTIPYSERIGFIAKVDPDDEEDVDYPFYVTAHEVAHQWWAHQVIGGDVQGSTLLSETLAQYSALMVMKKQYGDARMKRFLHYELDRYLTGRSFEKKKEMPLYRVEDQPYIHYAKGSLAMYALQDYLGEDTVNRALAAYRAEVAYQDPPYTTSRDLLAHLRRAAPEEMRYLIEDLFETITIYDNHAVSASFAKKADGTYAVKIAVSAKKIRADELGAEREIPMNDLVEIGVLDRKGQPLFLEKRRIGAGVEEFSVTVAERPAKAGIDPLNKLIDRDSDDNVVEVKEE